MLGQFYKRPARSEKRLVLSEAQINRDIGRVLASIVRTIDEHPGIRELFNDVDLHVARRLTTGETA
jgi:hypothetical protein